jgi:hypothetical protein
MIEPRQARSFTSKSRWRILDVSAKAYEATMKQAKYRRLWDVTATVIRSWDPYWLLASGPPLDEFDREISSVVAQIPRIHSAVDASHAVSRVFASSFQADEFTVEKCSEVGQKLYAALSEQGLID